MADPAEHQDMAAVHPQIVAMMSQRVGTLNKGVFEGVGPAGVTDEQVCAVSAKNGNFLTPSDWRKDSAKLHLH